MTRVMTREEAIKTIQELMVACTPDSKYYKVGEMAIKALSQEPTEKPMCDRNICVSNEYNGIGCDECVVNKAEQQPCDDVVSREAVKELIKCGVSTDTYDDVEQVCKWIDALPSVNPQPCDDAISREQAIKVIRQITSRYTLAKESCGMGQVEWSDYLIKESDAIDGLNELPSVTPIQKTNYYGVKTVLLSEDNK